MTSPSVVEKKKRGLVYLLRARSGECVQCGEPTSSGTLCPTHRKDQSRRSKEYHARLYVKRKRAGVCVQCGRTPLVSQTLCATHWAANLAYTRARRAKEKQRRTE